MGNIVCPLVQCAHLDGGRRCETFTPFGQLCMPHSISDLGLSLLRSRIPGTMFGLRAAKVFEAGEHVAWYSGIVVERSRSHPNRDWLVWICSTRVLDTRRSDEPGLARWVNSSRGTGLPSNVRIVTCARTNSVRLVASSRIVVGEEILADY